MEQETTTTSRPTNKNSMPVFLTGLLVGLIIGGLIGYIFCYTQVQELQNRIDVLEASDNLLIPNASITPEVTATPTPSMGKPALTQKIEFCNTSSGTTESRTCYLEAQVPAEWIYSQTGGENDWSGLLRDEEMPYMEFVWTIHPSDNIQITDTGINLSDGTSVLSAYYDQEPSQIFYIFADAETFNSPETQDYVGLRLESLAFEDQVVQDILKTIVLVKN